MKNPLLLISLLLCTMACKNPEQKEEKMTNETDTNYRFLLGTYTETPDQGINLITFHPEGEGFKVLSIATEPRNPSFITISPSRNLAFSVEETGGEDGGKVTSFSLKDEQLSKINSVSAVGNGSCYVTLDPSEKFAVAANYSGGNFSVIPVGDDGKLSPAVHTIKHEGSSVNPSRQKQPYVHSAVFHPKDHRLFIADLGTDEVVVYDFDAQKDQPLTETPVFTLKVAPGAGPRHLVFSGAGDRMYLVHEITAEIGVYTYQDGKLDHLETKSLVQDGFEGQVGAAEVRITEDDQYLYVSNRGEANEIIGFKILEDGKLDHIQTISSGGDGPRNFNITPDGEYLLVGNQNSNTLLAFKRNPETGLLEKTNHTLEVFKPVYIKFL